MRHHKTLDIDSSEDVYTLTLIASGAYIVRDTQTINLPRDLIPRLQALAKQERRSITAQIAHILDRYLPHLDDKEGRDGGAGGDYIAPPTEAPDAAITGGFKWRPGTSEAVGCTLGKEISGGPRRL